MIPQSEGGGKDRDFWEGQARKHFATFLHAAALDPTGRRTMRDVQRWVANPKAASQELNTLLKLSPDPTPYLEDLNQFIDLADKTQTSITNAITPALGWLTSPSAGAATEGGTLFDGAELIRQRGTANLRGRHDAQPPPPPHPVPGRPQPVHRPGRQDPDVHHERHHPRVGVADLAVGGRRPRGRHPVRRRRADPAARHRVPARPARSPHRTAARGVDRLRGARGPPARRPRGVRAP